MAVDDHPALLAGLGAMIASTDDMQLVATASSCEEAMAKHRQHAPDVTIVDLRLPDGDGASLICSIRARAPQARFIVLTTFRGDANARQALLAGANGYLLKTSLPDDLIDTIRSVHAGQHRISSEVAQDIAEHYGDEVLSSRELEVLRGVAAGLENKRIAQRLGLSVETVKDYLSRVMGKLHATNRTHAVAIAIKRGFLG